MLLISKLLNYYLMKDRNKKMRIKSLEVIPGGNSLLSKRSEMFSPEKWPGFFKSTDRIFVTDLNNKKYSDFSHFSVGTNTLGYNNKNINSKVKEAIDKGTMSTLNSFEEVLLAEKITEMHPWSKMARFCRTGGEANSLCIRIARASTGKDKILFSGYHGWHDWYLSANLSKDDALDGHLLPGLFPSGVPKSLIDTSVPFRFGDLEKVEKELSTRKYAAVKMEVMRNIRPTKKYLKEIRFLCDKYDTLLIFDECTSGFRESFGGMHLNFGVYPDLCVLGKTIGNGFPITCVIGTEKVMKNSSSSFISSTFWTDRIGFVAALASLKEMEKLKSWEIITELGTYYKMKLDNIFKELNIDVIWSGMPALIGYQIKSDYWLSLKTKITDELLQKNYLHGALFYPSVAHTKSDIDQFSIHLKGVLKKLKQVGYKNIYNEMRGKECHTTFKRLN